MSGIKETTEAIQFVGAFISTTGEIAADGKVSIFELSKYISLWPKIAPAVENAKQVWPEVQDLDASERATLVAEFANALNLNKEQTEHIFEEGFEVVVGLVSFISKVAKTKKGLA